MLNKNLWEAMTPREQSLFIGDYLWIGGIIGVIGLVVLLMLIL